VGVVGDDEFCSFPTMFDEELLGVLAESAWPNDAAPMAFMNPLHKSHIGGRR
jgi:hypothetical protein